MRDDIVLRCSIRYSDPIMNGNHPMLDNMPRGTICIEDLEIGMTRYLLKTVTDRDIEITTLEVDWRLAGAPAAGGGWQRPRRGRRRARSAGAAHRR